MLTMYTLLQALPEVSEPSTPTIQYPLVYKVSRNNQTHLVVGTFHDASLSHFPPECRDLFKQCQTLLTETIPSLPVGLLQKYGLVQEQPNALVGHLNEYEPQFREEMAAVFKRLELDCPIDSVSPYVLFMLWDSLKGLKVDDALVAQVKKQAVPIVSLNPIEAYLQFWHSQVNSAFYSEESFCFMRSKHIAQYYRNNRQLHPTVQQELGVYLREDIRQNRIPDEMLKELTSQNEAWLQIFMQEHEKGKNNMLLACGYEHLLGNKGQLARLNTLGFTVHKYVPGLGFPQESNHRKNLSFT